MLEGIYVGQSRHGRGIFASRNIKRNELILVFSGELKEGYRYDEYLPFSQYWLQIDDRKWIDPKPPGRFVNHSCKPNAALYDIFELRALRNISQSEEIYFDYDTTDWDSVIVGFRCLCNNENCRGLIRGYFFINGNVRSGYKENNLIPSLLLDLENGHSF